MNYADRVQETTTSAGTGALTLAGASSNLYRAFSPAIPTGAKVPYGVSDALGNWEIGYGTLTAATTLSRDTVLANSLGTLALINFPAGTKTVILTVPAALIAAFQVSQDIAFAAAVPLTVAGTQYMPQQTVAGVIAFTVAASPVKGATAYVRLIADGTNVPTFTGMKEWGGSLGYLNTSRIVNEIQFFYDGYDTWYSISQAVNAVPEPVPATGVTITGPTSGVASSASTSFSVGVTPTGGTITGTVVVTPSDAGGGGTFAPTSVNLTSGAPTGTFTYTPNSTVTTRTISVTNNGSLTNPSNISYSVTAAATVPGAPTIGAATGGDTSASIAFTAPGSNGGSAILDYTATSSPGGFTATGAGSPLTVSGLTNGAAYTFTVKARNTVGLSAASAASNSVTPASAAAVNARFTDLAKIAESGTGPYTYTSDGTTGGDWDYAGPITRRAKSTMALSGGVDGNYTWKMATVGGSLLMAITSQDYIVGYTAHLYSLYAVGAGNYTVKTANVNQTATNAVAIAANDLVRFRRTGTTLYAEVSKDAGATWPSNQIIYSWTGVDIDLLFINCQMQGSLAISNLSSTGFTAPANVAGSVRFSTTANSQEGGVGPYFYTRIGSGGWGTATEACTTKIPANTSGSIEWITTTMGAEYMVGLSTGAAATTYSGYLYGLYQSSGSIQQVTSGSPGGVTTAHTNTVGDRYRLRRDTAAATVYLEFAPLGSSTWTTLKSWTGASQADLYPQLECNALYQPLAQWRGVALA